MSAPVPSSPFFSLDEPRGDAGPTVRWLWDGYLAAGNVTLLTSQWKAGKTTLLSVLLHKMKAGGELAGEAVRAGRAVVVSEEDPDLWRDRGRSLDLAGHVCFACRPFVGRPSADAFAALLDHVLELHAASPVALLALDPLAAFLPARTENDATTVLNALLPLHRLTAAGLAVLLPHHPRKGVAFDGRAARGSGTMTGWADVLLELHWFRSAADDNRRRRLVAWSRHNATVRERVIELTADGTDYVPAEAALTAEDEARARAVVTPLLKVLEGAVTKLTRRSILADWPPDYPPPSPKLLWQLLEGGVAVGDLRRDGAGTKGDPFRYWLPALEERWQTDSFARFQQEAQDTRRRVLRDLGQSLADE